MPVAYVHRSGRRISLHWRTTTSFWRKTLRWQGLTRSNSSQTRVKASKANKRELLRLLTGSKHLFRIMWSLQHSNLICSNLSSRINSPGRSIWWAETLSIHWTVRLIITPRWQRQLARKTSRLWHKQCSPIMWLNTSSLSKTHVCWCSRTKMKHLPEHSWKTRMPATWI